MAFLTPVGATKRGRQSASRLMPLSVVELQANISPTRDLHIPSGIVPIHVWKTIYYEPFKTSIIFFLSEFLQKILHEAPPEHNLWNFIANSIRLFDATTDANATANFHISFLISLMPLMGIQPDIENYTEGMEFDMKAGTMVLPFSLQNTRGIRIDADKSARIPKIARMNYANSRAYKFSGKERSQLLDYILRYYGCHFPGSDNLKSLDIMREIFS